jgi:hypothetical protein
MTKGQKSDKAEPTRKDNKFNCDEKRDSENIVCIEDNKIKTIEQKKLFPSFLNT